MSLFGTDGIRAEANRPPLDPATLVRIGRALGEALVDGGGPRRVLLGRDTRVSGPMVGGSVMAGLLSAGVDVVSGGVLSTPAVARLATDGRYGLGVVVSASHNPAGDNGVKVFLGDARKPDPSFTADVEARVGKVDLGAGGATGAWRSWDGGADRYLELLLAEFEDLDLSGTKLAVDCANGATVSTAPAALTRLGAKLDLHHAKPNGTNINRRCGAMHPKVVAAAVRRSGADVGITFDGDGDRVLFADERGRAVDGDATMAILARDLLGRRRLRGKAVVATVMSNLGLEKSLREIGVALVRTKVGDKHVVEEMDRGGYVLGGEQSGHIVVRKGRRLVGDGLETALHLLRALRRSGEPLSVLADCFRRAPQLLVNVRVSRKPPLADLPAVTDAIREAEAELAGEGRIVVRYSGTELLARVMVEATDRAKTKRVATEIAAVIEREIGSAT